MECLINVVAFQNTHLPTIKSMIPWCTAKDACKKAQSSLMTKREVVEIVLECPIIRHQGIAIMTKKLLPRHTGKSQHLLIIVAHLLQHYRSSRYLSLADRYLLHHQTQIFAYKI